MSCPPERAVRYELDSLECRDAADSTTVVVRARDSSCSECIGGSISTRPACAITAYSAKARASLEALPFADASFDVVSSNMVVEHLPDPARMLREVRRVLCPGGVFVFHTSSRFHWALWIAARMPDRLKLASAWLL